MIKIFHSLVVLFIALSLTGCVKSKINTMEHKYITLNGQTIDVEVAVTSEEQQKGLGGRAALAENQGMFFQLPTVSIPSFWMKDMKIPIDILWINSGVVVGIEQNIPADDGAKLYSPTQPIDSVLELSAGWAARHGTSVGDRIE
jgi:uncharacterized membrane protein (UPF0127 family)